MPVKGLTQAEIDEATRAQVASGAKSTDRTSRLPGETASEANARITAAYKEMTAKPIISQEAKDAGVQVKFVRTGAGGVGEYQVVKPIGYTGPDVSKTTEFTPGVIPANVKKTTGTSVGFNPDDYKTADDMQRIAAKLASGKALTADEQAFVNKGVTPAPATTPATTPGAPTVTSTAAKVYTPAELQKIVAKLTSGGTLTAEEKAAIGSGTVPTPTPAPTTKQFTPAELQAIVAKLGRGGTLTDEEKAAIGIGVATTTSPSTTTATTTTPTTTTPTTTTPTTTTPTTTTPTTTIVTVDPVRPIGTPPAFVYDPVSKTWKMPVKPTDEGNWVWDNNAGWTNTTVNPGSTGFEAGSDKTLAVDTFKNTLALYFGAKEMSQPWANALFKVVSNYYKTGATIDESLNLALQDARNKPELAEFTKRFAGVFALQDRRAAGEALDVPTIAEFFKSQVTLGDRLREVGLGDIATNEILGEVLGTGKSVAATLNLVNDVFMAIDNAPEQLKKDLAVVAPGIDRTSIAKALLLGKRGADELQKQIKEVSVLSAAKSQGIGLTNALAADYAARGFDYAQSLEGFGTVAKGAAPLQKLTEFSTQAKSSAEEAQKTLMKSIFEKDVKAQEQIRLEAEKEAARFSGASGTMGSRSLASRNRANRAI